MTGTVGDDLALLHLLAGRHDRLLVLAGALVGTAELQQAVDPEAAVALLDDDLVGGDVVDDAGLLGHDHVTGVDRRAELHAGAHERGLGTEQRHGLTLHVGAHQGPVRVVVLQERDQGGRHRDELLGRHVHVVDLVGRDRVHLAALAADEDQGLGERPVLVDRRVRLRDDVAVLFVGRQVVDLRGDLALLDAAVGSLDEAELVDSPVARERTDQADVRTFWRLDRAHATVVRRVDVSDLEARALTREPARPERREPALVGEAGQRVRLVHELRELRGAEELLDRRDDRADVDQGLRRDRLDVLGRHALLDHALHAGQADPDLVLDQLADAAEATVAEVVDVVGVVALVAGVQVHEVAHRLQHVLVGEDGLVLRCTGTLLVLQLVREDPVLELLPGLLVGVVELPERLVVRAQLLEEVTVGGGELLVDLVAADLGHVVPLRVEEQVLEQGLRALGRGRLARAELAVDVLERLLLRLDVILLERVLDRLGVAEERQDLVGRPTERLQQDGHDLTALAVDADADRVLLVDVELQPRTAAGDDLGDVDVLVGGLVELAGEVDPGRAHELGDDDPLGAVDDEGAPAGHDREVPHEDFLLLDLARHLVDEGGLDEQRLAVGDVAVTALLFRGLDVLELMLTEVELELLGEVLDRGDFLEDLFEPLVQEPVERLPLDAHEIGKRQDLVELGETDTVANRDKLVRQKDPSQGS